MGHKSNSDQEVREYWLRAFSSAGWNLLFGIISLYCILWIYELPLGIMVIVMMCYDSLLVIYVTIFFV